MRSYSVWLFILLGLGVAGAQSPPASNADSIPAVSPDAPEPMAVPGGVNVHWYGHGFVYLISSVGIRAAIDPFGPEIVHYKFPTHLTADFVMISHEAEDHSAADLIFGDPLIFRSVMAVGLQRANGIPFHGIALQKDPSGEGGANTAFTLNFDGVTFCYLGQISLPLLAQEKTEIGHVDVIFLPVGLTTLSVGDFNQIVTELGAKIVIPINYQTNSSGILSLRTVDEYLGGTKFPVHKINSDEIVITRGSLPDNPVVYVLKSP